MAQENKVLSGVRIAYGVHGVKSENTAFRNLLVNILTANSTLSASVESLTRSGAAYAIVNHTANDATAIIEEMINESYAYKGKQLTFLDRCGFKIGTVDGKKALIEWNAPEGWTLENAKDKIYEMEWEEKKDKVALSLDDSVESLAFLLDDRKGKVFSGKKDFENKGASMEKLYSFLIAELPLIAKLAEDDNAQAFRDLLATKK